MTVSKYHVRINSNLDFYYTTGTRNQEDMLKLLLNQFENRMDRTFRIYYSNKYTPKYLIYDKYDKYKLFN